jgi:hypothetical protein
LELKERHGTSNTDKVCNVTRAPTHSVVAALTRRIEEFQAASDETATASSIQSFKQLIKIFIVFLIMF